MTRETLDHDTAYRRFERAAEWPMLVLSMIFVALLIGPEIVEMDSAEIDLAIGMIWAVFGLEVVTLFSWHRRSAGCCASTGSMCSSSRRRS